MHQLPAGYLAFVRSTMLGHRACHVYRSRCVFLPSYTHVCTITSLHGCTVDSIRLHVGRKYHIQIPEPHQLRPMPTHSR